jgi:hypothetical protein
MELSLATPLVERTRRSECFRLRPGGTMHIVSPCWQGERTKALRRDGRLQLPVSAEHPGSSSSRRIWMVRL